MLLKCLNWRRTIQLYYNFSDEFRIPYQEMINYVEVQANDRL
jgi:hypothetical protein